jgi:ring-1,2-phenylacetyl-CoA epoxidase subunit PaaA
LRREFVDEMAPEILSLGLSLPDPDLRRDPLTGHWIHGPIDWEEFWQVVKGNGPCNKERMEARRTAHEDGRWVRDALAAYGQRQKDSEARDRHPMAAI